MIHAFSVYEVYGICGIMPMKQNYLATLEAIGANEVSDVSFTSGLDDKIKRSVFH